MAKKSYTPEPPPSPAPMAPPSPSLTLADAIRGALDDLGVDSSRSEVEGWIKAKYPSMQYKDATLNSSLSNIRKKLREGGNGPAGGQTTLNDLLKVKVLADEQGGVDGLLAQIEKMESLAAKAGGLSRLRQCLTALKKIKA